ncbi:MAG: hypothetical protein ACFFCP_05530 [Promethearchaeota archaeon]
MYSKDYRSGMEIPYGVSPEDIMRTLEIGHGYRWLILTRQPLIVAHGTPTLGNMPEILITGSRTLVISGENPAYVERIRQVLVMLQRHSPQIAVRKEGGNSD